MSTPPEARSPLYRPEAVAHQRERAWGELVVRVPWVARVLLALIVLLCVAFVIFVFQAEYTRKARASAVLVYAMDPTTVAAVEAGTLLELAVKEGDAVRQGQLLAVISTERTVGGEAVYGASVADAASRKRALDAEKNELSTQMAALERQLVAKTQAIEAERGALTRELSAQQTRVTQLQAQVDRFRELAKSKFVSELQVQQKEDERAEQLVKLETLRRNDATLARDLANARAELPLLQSNTRTRLAALERDRALQSQTAREDASRKSYEVRAAGDAIVERVIATPGQTITIGTPLLRLQSGTRTLEVDVFVPTRAAGFLREGQAVRLAIDAFPFERFGHISARVARIGRVVLLPGEPGAPSSLKEPTFRVRVLLDQQEVVAYGERFPLKPGLAAQADIALDSRPLYRWVIEPILRLRGAL